MGTANQRWTMNDVNVGNDSIERLCNSCGKTFSAFLHGMADQNAKVVCPDCREVPDCKPAKAAKTVAGARSVKKTV
jgi:hypothetical protein